MYEISSRLIITATNDAAFQLLIELSTFTAKQNNDVLCNHFNTDKIKINYIVVSRSKYSYNINSFVGFITCENSIQLKKFSCLLSMTLELC